jgi:hypothetical protein
MLWNKTIGGSNDDVGLSVVETKDGGYVFTGLSGGRVSKNTIGEYESGGKAWLIKEK